MDLEFFLDYFFMPQMVQNGTQNKALFILSGERKLSVSWFPSSRYSEGSARYEEDDDFSASSGDEPQSEPEPERKKRRSKVQVSGNTHGEENSENESLGGMVEVSLFFLLKDMHCV